MWRWIPRVTALLLVAAVLILPAAQVAARGEEDPLAAVRQATDKFHSVDTAVESGYAPLLACFDQPGVGGMGQHYVKASLLDSTVTSAQPEALVYEVEDSRLKLVAVEYIIPQAAWTSSQPPRLFGHWFYRNDALGLWALHAWIWRHNPLGTFANYNPRVKLCPGH